MQVALLALAAAIVSGAVIGAGSASTSTKPATASFTSPASVAAGSTTTYTLRLVNGSANQTLGSANVTVPSGFVVAGAFTQSRPWESPELLASTDGKVAIALRAGTSKNAIPPGQELLVTFAAKAPCAAPADPQWTTVAKQSNDFKGPPGNDFFITQHPTMPISGGGAAAFAFAAIEDPQQVDTTFAVTVRATCGTTTDTSYNGTATLSGLTAGEYLPASLTFTSGVASAQVTPRTVEDDVSLTATAGTRTGSSNDFDVVQWLCTADDNDCYAADELGRTEVRTPKLSGDTKLVFAFDGRDQTTACGTDAARIGSRVTVDPRDYVAGDVLQVTFTWDKLDAPGTGVANFVLCWGEPGDPTTEMTKCPKSPVATCELKRSRTGVGDLEIVVLLKLQDPSFELG